MRDRRLRHLLAAEHAGDLADARLVVVEPGDPRARVAGATSARPLTTFETVGTDTPAASAISEVVTRAAADTRRKL